MHSAALNLQILAAFFGGWEVVLVLAIILILFGATRLPDLAATIQRSSRDSGRSSYDDFVLWLAQGFDVGRIPMAPGTFGSLVGVLWVVILLVPGSLTFYLVGTLLGIGVSVWACGEAERILGKTDPGSVVLDEIAALPICFLPWVTFDYLWTGTLPSVETLDARSLYLTAMIFVLFRLFDVMKPWPVRQSQNLPGGWGVTVDDLLAAVYVGLVSLFLIFNWST